MSWTHFAQLCREANRACANNLLVTLAACHGQQALQELEDANELTPFCMLLAASASTTVSDVVRFSDFYETLLASEDVDQARWKLPDGFDLYYCEDTLVKLLIAYIRERTMGKGRRMRVEKLLTEVRKARPELRPRDARDHIKSRIDLSQDQFDRYRNSFLLADSAVNKDRFKLSHAQLLAFAKRAGRTPTRG